MAEGQSGSAVRWVVILIFLAFIGVTAFMGLKSGGWMRGMDLSKFTSPTFFLNTFLIGGFMILVGYFTPPFKDSLNPKQGKAGTAAYVLILLFIVIGGYIAFQLGDLKVYQHEFIKWLFPFQNDQFNFKPLANVGIFWFLIAFILPILPLGNIGKKIGQFFQKNDGTANTPGYVLAIVIALILAYNLVEFDASKNIVTAPGIWEHSTFTDIEEFLFGERAPDAGLFGEHTGMYPSKGKIKYGILKIEVDSAGKKVYPLPSGIIVFILLLAATSLSGRVQAALAGLNQFRFWIFGFIAVFAANSGVSLNAILYVTYAGIVFAVYMPLSAVPFFNQDGRRIWALAAAVMVADYAAQILTSFGFFTSPPPFIPWERPIAKLITLVIVTSLFIFLRGVGGSAIRSIASMYRCRACNRKCEETPVGSEDYVCPHCGPTPPTCESIGGLGDVGCMIGMNLGRRIKEYFSQSAKDRKKVLQDIENELKSPPPGGGNLPDNLAKAVENGYFNRAGDILNRIQKLVGADREIILQRLVKEEKNRPPTGKKFAAPEYKFLTEELTKLLNTNLAQEIETNMISTAGQVISRIDDLPDTDKLIVLQKIVNTEKSRPATDKKFAPAEFGVLTNALISVGGSP